MTITISNEKGFDEDFFNWLPYEVRDYIIASIDPDKLIKVDTYINTNKFFHSPFKDNISSKDVIVAAANNLKVDRYWNRVVLSIDSNAVVPNTTSKILTVIKLVNFGSLSVMGYPVVTKCFKFVEDNIDAFYEKYLWSV